MPLDKIIGLVEVTRSHSRKINAEVYGGPRFESQDFFTCAQATCKIEDLEEVSADLNNFCIEETDSAAEARIYEYKHGPQPRTAKTAPVQPEQPTAPEQTPQPKETATAPAAATTTVGEYVIAEKKADPVAEQPKPKDAAPQTPPPDPSVIADRLRSKGVTDKELAAYARYYHRIEPGVKPTKQQFYVAFQQAEEWVKMHSIEKLRKFCQSQIANGGTSRAQEETKQQEKPAQPAAEPQQGTLVAASTTEDKPAAVFSEDPAVVEALKQVSAKWPVWSGDLLHLGALWCADQLKDAEALGAFLITCEITNDTPLVRTESLMAITRHLTFDGAKKLIEYAKKSKNPLSMIEEDLSRAIGQKIRFALDLDPNAVSSALDGMIAKVKK